MNAVVPEFAVIGHPNEGKSAVVSTLSEDDSVRVGPVPGETTVCRTFPVVIDGREVIRFVDTPGFQNPRRTLAWLQAYDGEPGRIVQAFIDAHGHDPDFRDECELLGPVASGAGIIYVVDGSRPLRKVDVVEMEILRLTARPRMAVINAKAEETGYLDAWKTEFRRQFNAIRVFNAHKAVFAERLDLLESLKRVEQDWQPELDLVIEVFKREWHQRLFKTAGLITQMVADILSLKMAAGISVQKEASSVRQDLARRYQHRMVRIEKSTHDRIRGVFKHNIFNLDLPPDSLVKEDLFSRKTWEFLGLKSRDVILAAGITGGAAGAALDVAAAGLSFGVFSAIGGLVGAGSAALGGRRMSGLTFKGIPLGRDRLEMGPADNIQLLYVLLDRALLLSSGVMNWAHGRREAIPQASPPPASGKKGFTAQWSADDRAVCTRFFQVTIGRKIKSRGDATTALSRLIEIKLHQMSTQ